MSAASPPPWPGSRVLLGWWRELVARRPQQMWFGWLLLHRVEALIRVTRARPLEPWHRALLSLVSTRVPCGGEPEGFLADLHVDRQILTRFVRDLTDAGLLHANGTGVWDLTAAGRHALQTGSLEVAAEERRTFYFVDNAPSHRPPHYLPLRQPPPAARSAAPDLTEGAFDPRHLEACIGQTPLWKARYHFPQDVEALLRPGPEDSPAANRYRVVLDSLEQQAFVFIRTAGASEEPTLLAFPARTEGWTLEPEPALTFEASWQDLLPDLSEEPPPEAWRQAWQAWSHPRGLPSSEVGACRLERVEHRLRVRAPHRLIDRLQAARSDAIKQEAWLLAGTGRTRTAAQLELLPL